MKIIVVLLLCWAAAVTVPYAHDSEAWQRVLMFVINLQWPSREAANVASDVLEALLAALLGGTFSTLLVLSTRLSAVAAAGILSVAVFVGADLGLLLNMLGGGNADFLAGHVMVTAVFFVGGWLIAALVGRIRKNGRTSA